MRVFIVQTFYPEFLCDVYARTPGLATQNFSEQHASLFAQSFSTSDAYSFNLRSHGCETLEVICNADAAQHSWAKDHGIELLGNLHDQRRQIIAAQIAAFDPDVVYVFEWCPLGDAFLAKIGDQGRLLVGEIASPLPPNRSFGAYDVMISSLPPIVEYFRDGGKKAEYIRLGFDERVLQRINFTEPQFDVSFVGGFAPSHPDRIAWLEDLLDAVDVDVFCYGLDRTGANSRIREKFRGQAWGLEMYRALQQSRITLNRHACIEVNGSPNIDWCNNMRMYEATGVGACLLTESRKNLTEHFEPDVEVVTYASTAECIEKIRHLLRNEKLRMEVARAGTTRTLRDHLYKHRMVELADVFRRNLKRRGALVACP